MVICFAVFHSLYNWEHVGVKKIKWKQIYGCYLSLLTSSSVLHMYNLKYDPEVVSIHCCLSAGKYREDWGYVGCTQ